MHIPEGIKVTPMLEQYIYWKEKYPDCLLFFRMGDFYEMFFDDAKIASSVLDIVLTSRSKDSENQIPMAGVPFHAVDNYIGRLIAAGYRIAICEQITEPDGKTLVKRSVGRIITPGTYIPETGDGEAKIASFIIEGNNISIALLDTADGTLKAGTFGLDIGASTITAFSPNEILLKKGQAEQFKKMCPLLSKRTISEREKSEFIPLRCAEWLCRRWKIATLSSMGIDDRDFACAAAASVLKYVEETQFSKASHITGVTPLLQKGKLILDQNTQVNLELITSDSSSLFYILNKTSTAMGKRRLKEWIIEPLCDIEKIEQRQNMIEELINNSSIRETLRNIFQSCRDIGKSLTRINMKTESPMDLLAIKETLLSLPDIISCIKDSCILSKLTPKQDISEFTTLLNNAVAEKVPRLLREGGVIKKGYCAKLDEWRSKAQNTSAWLTSFEEHEREKTGIKTLKVGVNKVFGYYIEISKVNARNAPKSYIRKQTLVNAERFITDDLKKFEEEIFSAESRIQELEESIYKDIIAKIIDNSSAIHDVANFIAELDTLLSLAFIASERGYTKPYVDMSKEFVIKNARHPVIEITLGKNPFTPNDFNFSSKNGRRIAIITGPNMAGKSTYLRTAALITIMAHMGSFIPAESAHIGLVDRVFTRIGARDELARGQSTFMVEMVETANILRHSTDRSLVILDEVGRGTSTYDGLSIAWAVVEYLQGQENSHPRVFFATHYHELTQMADLLSGVVNLSMDVEETDNGVIFLHKIIEAPSDRSYGIEVARLAGIPPAVVCRSKELLSKFENDGKKKNEEIKKSQENQLTLFDSRQEAILEELALCNPDNMTPLVALELVVKLRQESRKIFGLS